MKRWVLVLFSLAFLGHGLFTTDLRAAESEARTDSLISVSLKDGSRLVGKVIQETDQDILIRTLRGLEVRVPRSEIVSARWIVGRASEKGFYRLDPNYSRLMFAPTGRPLSRGDGYFSDVYVFFPSVAVGLTNQITLLAGLSIAPGVGLDEQAFFLAPKIGFRPTEKFAFSVGTLAVSVTDFMGGLGFGVATVGGRDASLTCGVGIGYTKKRGNDFEFADDVIVLVGGNLRVSNGTALISENWLLTGKNFDTSEQPFGIAIRFFGDRLAADFGFILIGEVLKEGLPVPWLSIVYNFGKPQSH